MHTAMKFLLCLLLAAALLAGCAKEEEAPAQQSLKDLLGSEVLSQQQQEAEEEPAPEEPEALPEEIPEEVPEEEPAQRPAQIIGETPAEEPEAVEEVPEEAAVPSFPEELALESLQAFVYDCERGEVLAMKGEGERLSPASVTKLLSILTALDYVPADAVIRPGEEQVLVAADSSIAYVNSEHTLTAAQLVEGMLLPSGNDAACALAAAAGRAAAGDESLAALDAVDVFVEKMNEKAAALGMSGSHFVTPDGYYDENHYTTVEDMVALTVAAWDNELIRRYSGIAIDEVVYHSGHTNTWTNTNYMLHEGSGWYSPYVKGIKTGSLTNAYCLVVSIEKDGHTWLAGVFSGVDDYDRYGDMTAIVNWLTAE